MQKIGTTLEQPEAVLLKSTILSHLKNRNLLEGEFLIETNYDAGTIDFVDSDTGDSLCILPSHLFTTELRDSKSITVSLEASIELYTGTQYPKSFKALLNIFIEDIREIVKPIAGRHVVNAECPNGYSITLTGDYDSMEFLSFVPKHFTDFCSSEHDDLDFVVDIQQTFKVNKK